MSRIRLAQALLWVSVVNAAIWMGGTVFMMLVFNPLWTASPPESVRAYWVEARFYESIFNFFGPWWQFVRTVPVIGALLACWNQPRHRPLLLVNVGTLLAAIAMTLFYIYPMNDVLFTTAIDSLSRDAAREMTANWVVADRARFAIMCAGFVCLLRAFSIPIEALD
jgi:uncharacterized membrane protein